VGLPPTKYNNLKGKGPPKKKKLKGLDPRGKIAQREQKEGLPQVRTECPGRVTQEARETHPPDRAIEAKPDGWLRKR